MLSDVVGERIATIRRAQGLSREELAQRCSDLGWPMTAAVLTNIESGRRQDGVRRREVTADEMAVIAQALDTPPVLLACPVGVAAEVEIAPGRVLDTWTAARWWSGETRLDGADVEDDQGAAPLYLYREHQRRVDDVTRLIRGTIAFDPSQEGAPSAFLASLTYDGWPAADREAVENSLRELVEVRRQLRRFGLLVPVLPEALAGLEGRDDG